MTTQDCLYLLPAKMYRRVPQLPAPPEEEARVFLGCAMAASAHGACMSTLVPRHKRERIGEILTACAALFLCEIGRAEIHHAFASQSRWSNQHHIGTTLLSGVLSLQRKCAAIAYKTSSNQDCTDDMIDAVNIIMRISERHKLSPLSMLDMVKEK